ncbi:MAG: restriction endonuclease subunit S [Cyanobacteria bacterium J06581_3]
MSFPKYEAYKDSGVEWLGEVPEHWDVCLAKYICDEITDGAHISPDTESGIYPFISIKDIAQGVIDFDNALLTSADNYRYLERTGCKPAPGDVLFSKDGTIGQTAITPRKKDFVVASSLIILRPNRKAIQSEFLDYLLQSFLVQEQVNSFVKGAVLRRLSIQNLSKIQGIFPELKE